MSELNIALAGATPDQAERIFELIVDVAQDAVVPEPGVSVTAEATLAPPAAAVEVLSQAIERRGELEPLLAWRADDREHGTATSPTGSEVPGEPSVPARSPSSNWLVGTAADRSEESSMRAVPPDGVSTPCGFRLANHHARNRQQSGKPSEASNSKVSQTSRTISTNVNVRFMAGRCAARPADRSGPARFVAHCPTRSMKEHPVGGVSEVRS